MLKKALAIILCIILSLNLIGCSSSNKKNEVSKKPAATAKKLDDISMLYCRSDSFDPYTAASDINRQLCRLLYEPLIIADSEFNAVYRLAKNVTVNESVCQIELRDTVFSDGSPLTAQDVVYSFNKAKSSATLYNHKLYEFTSAEAIGEKTVAFTVTRQDPYIQNLLDFPIIKAGSDTLADSDGVLYPPIGCGRYILSTDKSYLYLNESFYGKSGEIKKISLINTPDADAVSHYVEVGAVSFYYADLKDGNVVRMSGKKADVSLNNFVYIGINSAVPILQNKYLRYAISSALDREKLCADAFHNNATPANGFYNGNLKAVSAVQSLLNNANLQITIENLEKIGYNRLDNEGYRINSAGTRLSLNLLVNSENRPRVLAAEAIASQLKTAGIKINIIERPFEQYIAALNSGTFELYLGEIYVLPNLDLSQLVLKGGSAAYGVGLEPPPQSQEPNEGEAEAQKKPSEPIPTAIEIAIQEFYSGKITISDLAGVLLTEMPQIPICYRTGLLFYDERIKGLKTNENDIYFNIEEYTNKN